MSDPSSVSGDFDFNHILTSQISRVEILKGIKVLCMEGSYRWDHKYTNKKGEPDYIKI